MLQSYVQGSPGVSVLANPWDRVIPGLRSTSALGLGSITAQLQPLLDLGGFFRPLVAEPMLQESSIHQVQRLHEMPKLRDALLQPSPILLRLRRRQTRTADR